MVLRGKIEQILSCHLELNFKEMDKTYVLKEGTQQLYKMEKISLISREEKTNYHGFLGLYDIPKTKIIQIKILGAENLVVNCDIIINGTKIRKKFETYQYVPKPDCKHDQIGGSIAYLRLEGENIESLKTLKGKLEFKFKPSYEVRKKQKLMNFLYKPPSNSELDFQINCQGRTFKFNKQLLCSFSEVFQKMANNSYSIESKSGCVEIEDFLPETIESFQKMVFTTKPLCKEDMSVDLLMFANKYDIQYLKRLIVEHLIHELGEKNVYEVMEAAYLIDNDKLLKATAKFVKTNLGLFKDKEKWNQFKKAHPDCALKVMSLMMFSESN